MERSELVFVGLSDFLFATDILADMLSQFHRQTAIASVSIFDIVNVKTGE